MGIYVHQRRLPRQGRGAGTLFCFFTVNAELSQQNVKKAPPYGVAEYDSRNENDRASLKHWT